MQSHELDLLGHVGFLAFVSSVSWTNYLLHQFLSRSLWDTIHLWAPFLPVTKETG